ncbi:MAG: hypothetical protein RMJ28_04115 [Nitrososphaerota archaeon]|nr:hypothetical protein [Candidatus Calditenuaceae archaeon]MDW8073405.1 hypothetical protein [Nitrososphaerota archaeon]
MQALFRLLFAALIGVVLYFLVVGAEAFMVGPVASYRPQDLKGGGWLGYKLGYVGALMLITAQTFLFRPGLLRRYSWLSLHCYLTVAGGALILIHSGFPYSFAYWNPLNRIHLGMGLYGLVGLQGVAAWLVIALIASGVYGRYVYRRAKVFRGWLLFHSAASGLLYVAGVIHLFLAVYLKYVTAA